MHSLLNTYLEQVAAHLTPLPVKRRNEELVEMRQHLLNAVIVNRELGQSEEDAAAGAVMQFGAPQDLGGNLVWAWKRERRLNCRSFWSAVGGMFLLMVLRGWVFDSLVNLDWIQTTHHVSYLTAYLLRLALVDVPCLALMGAGIGRLFPKRAVAGTAVVQSMIFGACAVLFFKDNLGVAPAYAPSEFNSWGYVAINYWFMEGIVTLPMALAPILGAWFVSRRRKTRAGRMSHARTA